MSSQPIKAVFGTGSPVFSQDNVENVYRILQQNSCGTLDVAQYHENEHVIGQTNGATKWNFNVDTKELGGFAPGTATRDTVVKRGEESFAKIGAEKLDVFYLHSPDPEVELSSTLEGINVLHQRGRFRRFGLSNFSPDDVETVISTCREKGYVEPTVYQGNYSPVARRLEEDLFPVLRKHGLAFYAYSPLAAGFLVKKPEDVASDSKWNKPSYLEALSIWDSISQDLGIGKPELSYRWVAYNSLLKREHGDAVIVGASSTEQLEQTLQWLKKGPLPDEAAKRVDEVWQNVKKEEAESNHKNLYK